LANHKSAAKRARQTIKKTTINRRTMGTVRTIEKKVRAAIGDKKIDEAKKLFHTYSSEAAKAAQKGVIHFRTASRKIGRLAKQVSKLG